MTGPTGGSVGTTVLTSGELTSGVVETVTATTARISTTFNVTPTLAGTYTLLVWVDESGVANNDTVPLVTDRQQTFSFTTSGAPASVSLTSTAKSGTTGVATPTSFGFTLLDAAGAKTYLLAGETLSGSVADVSANATGATLFLANGTTTTVTSDTFTAGVNRSITVDSVTALGSISVAASLSGVTRATIVGSGLLTGVVPAVTADLTTVAYAVATKFELSTLKGVHTTGGTTTAAPTAIASQTAAGNVSVTASNASARSLSFKVTTGSTPSTIQYTIAAISTTVALPTGVTAGTYTATTTGDSATATIAIAATAAVATSGYTITVPFDATTTMKYTVTYAAPTVSDTMGYVTVSPTTADTAKTLIGGSATVTATVRDQFGDVFSGANVIWTVTGRNASTSAGVSSATGVATLTITDAALATSTTVSDAVTATAAAATATAYTSSSAAAAKTSFAYVASMTVGTLTLTNSQTTATLFAAGTDVAALLDTADSITAKAVNAAGANMSGIPVTFTLPAGAYVAAGTLLTVYTNASGVAVLDGIKGTITGTNTASASAGGATATTNWTVANSVTDGRVITINSPTMAVSGSSAGQAIVTVKDRYGNLVGGAAFSLTYIGTAGRVAAVNGVIASSGSTDALTGTARIDITAGSTEAGTGTLTVSLTSADASTATTMGNGAAYTTAVAKVSSAVTVGATKSAEVTAIEAVAAKAAADKAESDAKIALLQAALDAAATKAAADKLAIEAAIAAAAAKAAADTAAAQAAAVAASEAAADAAAEAIDAGNNAFDAATSAGEAADAATAAAEQAGEDATAAANAAGEAAVAAAEAAQEAAAEATDAANAATDAANASAEAADAATAAAQDAADAVAALSVQVTEVIATLKKQITALTNLVIRIQKKVKA
jgi:hypothetical protein